MCGSIFTAYLLMLKNIVTNYENPSYYLSVNKMSTRSWKYNVIFRQISIYLPFLQLTYAGVLN